MFDRDRYTFIIQGPLSENGISNIENYHALGHVIVSTWKDNENSHLLNSLLKKQRLLDTLILDDLPKLKPSTQNHQNVFYHCKSILNGLCHSSTEFSIKVRCDESFSDMKSFLFRLENNAAKNKVVTSDIYFRKDSYAKFHISDHIIGCKTTMFYDTMRFMEASLHDKSFYHGLSCAEQIFCKSFFKILELPFNASSSIEMMKRAYDICPVELLGDIIIKDNDRKMTWRTWTKLFSKTVDDIKHIDEL